MKQEFDITNREFYAFLQIRHYVQEILQNNIGVESWDKLEHVITLFKAETKKLIRQGDIAYKKGRNALDCTDCLWPKSSIGTVNIPYVLSSVYSASEVSIITAAMQEFMTLTCVRFVPQTEETDYLDIKSEDGCWSYVGMNRGVQTVSLLKDYCLNHGTVQHELNHALGFLHEQCRSDRDNYVTVMTQYIIPEDLGNFIKDSTNNLHMQYDYSSLMHYPRYAFSKTGQDTIVPIPDTSVPIGQSYGLSNVDILKIKHLYDCDICSSLLFDSTGTVTSANYPSAYLDNTNCLWLIRTPADKIFMTFEAFDIQFTTNCISDYVIVYDGPSETYPVLLNKTCGSGILTPLVASSNSMLLKFVSDGTITATGFKASYSTVYCGATINTNPGVITSPGYPNLYPPSVDCFWIITASPENKRITINFDVFNLETYPYCRYDYVRIYDGKTTSSPLIGTFCGRNSFNRKSTGNAFLIKFHSDYSNQYPGFSASYKFKLKNMNPYLGFYYYMVTSTPGWRKG
ncbi:embryonic protein UVS.2-like [Bombina bombina]|uniref:embryonic protein UVS.2-like n=1 Tax=Bombina bombina TaxID=8345 RepID=UPI00235A9E3E|nr:embryonic protein UVS.2-like [Bombina bombina]